jgi:hypothetical protein
MLQYDKSKEVQPRVPIVEEPKEQYYSHRENEELLQQCSASAPDDRPGFCERITSFFTRRNKEKTAGRRKRNKSRKHKY